MEVGTHGLLTGSMAIYFLRFNQVSKYLSTVLYAGYDYHAYQSEQ